MGEVFGSHIATRAFLQVVVADFLCGIDGLLEVAGLYRAEHLFFVIAPNSRIVVGLQLYAYAGFVLLRLVLLGHFGVSVVEGAEQVLNVVSHLVGYDVGTGEIALGTEFGRKFIEKVKVEI